MREIDPKQWSRASAYELWMNAPMPMVTVFKTLDVTRLARLSRRRGMKFNMLLCWCVGRAASRVGSSRWFSMLVDSSAGM